MPICQGTKRRALVVGLFQENVLHASGGMNFRIGHARSVTLRYRKFGDKTDSAYFP
jgi:hypothetical protein